MCIDEIIGGVSDCSEVDNTLAVGVLHGPQDEIKDLSITLNISKVVVRLFKVENVVRRWLDVERRNIMALLESNSDSRRSDVAQGLMQWWLS